MRVSLLWLKDYVDLPESPAEVGEMLSRVGLVVDATEGEGDETVFDLDVTTNRSDCLSHIGVARELACVTGRPLRMPDVSYPEGGGDVGEAVSVKVEAPELCPRYTARVVRGVSIGESPEWMRKRLELAGLRPINNVVDATNFVLLEFGQPLHAFDLELLTDGTIIVRRAGEGERIVLLDGETRSLVPDDLVIADPREPVALAGVMGGGNSEINSQTADVLLESAFFEPAGIRRTARRLGISTDSSYRFERGVDPVGVDLASRRAVKLILETAGGEALAGVVDTNPGIFTPREVTLRFEYMERLLGAEVPAEEVAGVFRGLGMEEVSSSPASVTVRVPSWRKDLERPVDLVEEVARVRGYDRFPSDVGLGVRPVERGGKERFEELAVETFLAAGFDEAVTDSFVSEAEAALFPRGGALRVKNPVRKGQDLLRTSLAPSLLGVLSRALRNGVRDAGVFELGAVYLPLEKGALPEERRMLAAADLAGFRRLKGAVESLVSDLAGGRVRWRLQDVPGFVSGLSLVLEAGGTDCGNLGVISPEAAEFYELPDGTAVFECRASVLADLFEGPRFTPIKRFPPVDRDVALVVPEETPWLRVEEVIRENAPDALEEFRFVEVYRGKQVGAGKKSFFISFQYRRADRTMTDEEVNELHGRLVEKLLEETGGTLRA